MANNQHHRATLRRLNLSGWKSIKEIDPPLEFDRINIMIGSNGSGKSNLVSFFRMLNELIAGRLQEYIGRVGGADSVLHLGSKRTPLIEATVEFDSKDGANRYYLRLMHAAVDTLIFAEERLEFRREGKDQWKKNTLGGGHRESLLESQASEERRLKKANQPTGFMATVTRFLLTYCRVFHFHDTSDTAKIRQSCYVESNRYLFTDAGNLAAMLYRYRDAEPRIYRRIRETVRLMVPMFDDFVLEPQRLNKQTIILNWRARETDYEFGPHQFSDGTLRAIALTTLLLQPKQDLPDIIILDEPELGLHPCALKILSGMLKSVSVNTQLLIATQSAQFLDDFELKDIIVLDRIGHTTAFSRPEEAKLQEWLDDYGLGEIWQKNLMDGSPG